MSNRGLASADWRMPVPTYTMNDSLGIYAHFPFCLSKCAYCDFASLPLADAGGPDFARRYVDMLLIEIDRRAATAEFRDLAADTVFFGGGTPTVLPAAWLAEVLQRLRWRFAIAADAEITVEANPGTVDPTALSELRAAGFTRLSLGVQSFSDDSLRLLGRVHTAAQARHALAAARAAGFDDLSLDLIYGLPGQTEAEWQDDLAAALEVRPEHLSAYGLSLEEGTLLARAVAEDRLPVPEEERYAAMFTAARERLTAAGYEHYEISNYALPGRQCRHNRKYWAGDEYLGLGCSAHSHRWGRRWNNLAAPSVYTEWLARGAWPVARAEALSPRKRAGELMMLGLRTAAGVSEDDVERRTGLRPEAAFSEAIAGLQARGWLVREDGCVRVPPEWWLIANEILAEFVV